MEGTPGVSPTVSVSEFFLFGDLKKFGVSSPGMWAKSLQVPKMEVSSAMDAQYVMPLCNSSSWLNQPV